jgi:hypothetical protein
MIFPSAFDAYEWAQEVLSSFRKGKRSIPIRTVSRRYEIDVRRHPHRHRH